MVRDWWGLTVCVVRNWSGLTVCEPSPTHHSPADAVDNQVSEAQLPETTFAADIASGRVLFHQVDKGGRVSVLHQESLSRQLKKVG